MADFRRGAVVVLAAAAIGGVAWAGYLTAGGGATETVAARPGAVDSPTAAVGVAAGAAGSGSRPVVSPPPKNPDAVATDSPVPLSAAVRITYASADQAAGGVAVGAYVAGLVEDGGRCSLTLSLGGSSVTAQTKSSSDASTTSCGTMLVPFGKLKAGAWTVTVAYSSTTGARVAPGSSTVDVP